MRILFTTRGSAGHAGPLAPFAHAALDSGHDVLVAAQPRHRHNVDRLGLPFTPLADPHERAFGPLMAQLPTAGFDEANAIMLGEMFARVDAEATLPALRKLVDLWRPDLIVRESWEYASVLVAEERGIPLVRVALGLLETEELSIRLAAPTIDRLRAQHGLAPDPAGDRLRATPYLTVLPEGLEDPAAPRPAQTHRFRAPLAGPADLPDWWPGNDDPLVYVTFGSVTAGENLPYFPALYRAVIAALAPLPVRVLLTVGEPRDLAELGPPPENVHVAHWVPQDTVLQHAAVVVGHGGHGTTAGALRHGVPLALLPLFSVDQWLNAEAVQRAGAGIAIGERRVGGKLLTLPGASDLAAITHAVAHLIDDVPERRVAGDLANEMRAAPVVHYSIDVLAGLAGLPLARAA